MKPALIAAVIVIAAGFAVGVAVGGKTTTKTNTQTETVVKSVADQSATPTTTTPETTPGETPTTEESGPAKYLVTASDEATNQQNLSLDESIESGTIDGKKYSDAVTLEGIFSDDAADPASIEYSTDANTMFKAVAGFATDKTNSDMQATLTVRKDGVRGTKLWGPTSFTGSSGAEVMDFPTQGANKLIFVFEYPANPDNYQYDDNTFILGRARLTK